MIDMKTVLDVSHLCKHYGDKKAVDDVSLAVGAHEIVGLLGPNGAGKTTLINMIQGVLTPSSGEVHIAGHDIIRARSKVLSQANFAAVYAPLPGNLTVRENLHIFGMLYGVKKLSARIELLIQEFNLEQFRNTKCGVLSSGEQTRVALAKAMLNEPKLLLLDEPTASLDPATAQDIRARIRSFADTRGGVLWTSHNMHEVEAVCDRVLFLSQGKVLLEGNPKTLPAEHGKATLEELFIAVAREPLSLEAA